MINNLGGEYKDRENDDGNPGHTAIDQEVDDEDDDDDDDAPTFQIKLTNIVATVNLGMQLELQKIAHSIKNAEYNPTRFQAVIMRISQPRATSLLFRSGKLIVTGAKTQHESLNAAKKFIAILQKVGCAVALNDFKIQNITATLDLGFPIRLEGFLYSHAANSTYEPELFPGLVYRMTSPKIVLLIFVSGKIVLTGAKTTDAIVEAAQDIHGKLLEFRKTNAILTTIKSSSV
jgi:transcription initiation factor TFIID TATA-box-binding protein